MRIAYLSLLLAACTGGERAASGQCPAGEVCSAETPNGLHFVGASASDGAFGILNAAPATAVGGQQRITIQYDPGTGIQQDLDLPYTADDDGGLGVTIDKQEGPHVTLRGVAVRSNYLRIVEPGNGALMDRKEMTGAMVKQVQAVATNAEVVPQGAQVGFAVGHPKVGIALFGDVQDGNNVVRERIVDEAMGLAADGGNHVAWDAIELDAQAEATIDITVTAGNTTPAIVPVDIFATADELVPIDPQTVIAQNTSAQLCFSANAGAEVVVGFPWQFSIDGADAPASIIAPNCVEVTATKPSGTMAVAATAGGQTTTLEVTIGASAVRVPTKIGRDLGTTAGDRASL